MLPQRVPQVHTDANQAVIRAAIFSPIHHLGLTCYLNVTVGKFFPGLVQHHQEKVQAVTSTKETSKLMCHVIPY